MGRVAAVYVAQKPDIYTAQTRVQVDLESNPMSGATKSGTVVINSATNDPTYFNTQLQNLTSPGLLRRVVKTLDLEHNPSFLRPSAGQKRTTWQNLKRMIGLERNSPEEEAKKKEGGQLSLTGEVAPATAAKDLVEAKRLDPLVRLLQAGSSEPVRKLAQAPTTGTRSSTHYRTVTRSAASGERPRERSSLEPGKKTETTHAGDFLQKRVPNCR